MPEAEPDSLQARFLPCLLNRLTDLKPWERLESASERLVRPEQFRHAVEADLERLMWSTPTLDQELKDFPLAAFSAWNYGLPNLKGRMLYDESDRAALADDLRRRFLAFEPRILPQTLEVRVLQNRLEPDLIHCLISGRLWMLPYPERFLVQTVLDSGTGRIVMGDRIVSENAEA